MSLDKGIRNNFITRVRELKTTIATMKTTISLLEYEHGGALTVMEIDLLYKADDYLLDAEYTLDELIELMEAMR